MKNSESDENKKSLFGRKTSLVLALGAGALIVGAPFIAPVLAGPLNSDSLVDPEWENAVRKHVEKRFFNLIDATDSQKSQLDDLFKQRVEGNRQTREQVKKGVVEVAQLMADDTATDEQIRSKVKEIQKVRQQLIDSRLDTALKVRAILTKEQRQIVSNKVIGFITGNQRQFLLRSMN
ncbi:MAG: Spy/CpxP family protein refolding chaperone [Candidatus Melainabacteria bacterium]|nr:Spy/CpxP family protein refolding chaperone [Candidatus Melainabacteria bacterium]